MRKPPFRFVTAASIGATLFAAVGLTVFASACGPVDFEGSREVTKLRTLGIRSEPPEIAAGEVATISTLTVTPDPGAAIDLRWEVCLVDDGPDHWYRCSTDPETGERMQILEGSGATLELPFVLPPGQLEQICASFGEMDLPDFVELPDCSIGLPVTVRLTATAPGQAELISVKRVTLLVEAAASRPDRNENPVVSQLGWRGSPGEDSEYVPLEEGVAPEIEVSRADGTIEFSLEVDTASAQRYVAEEGAEPVPELYEAAWFATHGTWDHESTYYQEGETEPEAIRENALDLSAESVTQAEDGERVRVFAVVRDSRDGQAWISRDFIVRWVD